MDFKNAEDSRQNPGNSNWSATGRAPKSRFCGEVVQSGLKSLKWEVLLSEKSAALNRAAANTVE